MKAENINPFLEATADVFKLMLDLDITTGQLGFGKSSLLENNINIIINVTGDLRGFILFSFPQSMTLAILKIMSGMEMEEIDNFATSALSEMANIICGNAITYLSQKKYICDITPPSIIIKKNNPDNTKQTLRVPLQTSIGELTINIFLEDNKN